MGEVESINAEANAYYDVLVKIQEIVAGARHYYEADGADGLFNAMSEIGDLVDEVIRS